MDARTREAIRKETHQRRTRLFLAQRVYFSSEGLGQCSDLDPQKPIELCIEATNPDGDPTVWLTDEWWIRIRSMCADATVTVVILPTPNAVHNPVIAHQLEMVRRISPRWRIIAYALSSEVEREPSAASWLHTPYDEIRLFEDVQNREPSDLARKLIAEAGCLPRRAGVHQARVCQTRTLPYHFREGSSLPPPLPK